MGGGERPTGEGLGYLAQERDRGPSPCDWAQTSCPGVDPAPRKAAPARRGLQAGLVRAEGCGLWLGKCRGAQDLPWGRGPCTHLRGRRKACLGQAAASPAVPCLPTHRLHPKFLAEREPPKGGMAPFAAMREPGKKRGTRRRPDGFRRRHRGAVPNPAVYNGEGARLAWGDSRGGLCLDPWAPSRRPRQLPAAGLPDGRAPVFQPRFKTRDLGLSGDL